MMTAKNIEGVRFGRLTVISGSIGYKRHPKHRCICDCGNLIIAQTGNLQSGHTQSCGCLRRELSGNQRRIHGLSDSSEFRIWSGMKTRCLNVNNEAYGLYGGRGISICQRWDLFENFLADMGPRPSTSHSIDRIDNNGN